MEARDERRLRALQKHLNTVKLLIVDELGYVPFTAVGSELLFEVFSQRYERGSTIVTSNLPFDEWTSIFGSERLTGALLDRLTHHVHILESRVEDGRGGLGPICQHPVSRPRSSNRTCRFPASGSPVDFTTKLSVAIHSRRVPFAARRFLRT